MARLTLYFCDLCKQPRPQELEYKINIGLKKATSRKNPSGVGGDICFACYETLSANIKAEVDPSSPVPYKLPEKTVQAFSFPGNGVDTGDGINIVPSNLTDARRREMNKEQNDRCSHSTGFTMTDGGPVCKDCGEKVNL